MSSQSLQTRGSVRLHVFAPGNGAGISASAGGLSNVAISSHPDPNTALEAARAERGSVLVIENTGTFDLVEFLIRVSETAPTLPGIIIGDNFPILAVKRLMTLQRWDMLPPPIESQHLAETLEVICREIVLNRMERPANAGR